MRRAKSVNVAATRGGVAYLHGDFVQLAVSAPAADIVTLDRVINVYSDWERLLGLSAARASAFTVLTIHATRASWGSSSAP